MKFNNISYKMRFCKECKENKVKSSKHNIIECKEY